MGETSSEEVFKRYGRSFGIEDQATDDDDPIVEGKWCRIDGILAGDESGVSGTTRKLIAAGWEGFSNIFKRSHRYISKAGSGTSGASSSASGGSASSSKDPRQAHPLPPARSKASASPKDRGSRGVTRRYDPRQKNNNDPFAHYGMIFGFLAYLVVHEIQLVNFLEPGYSSNNAGDGPMTGLAIHGNRLKKNRPSMRRNPESTLMCAKEDVPGGYFNSTVVKEPDRPVGHRKYKELDLPVGHPQGSSIFDDAKETDRPVGHPEDEEDKELDLPVGHREGSLMLDGYKEQVPGGQYSELLADEQSPDVDVNSPFVYGCAKNHTNPFLQKSSKVSRVKDRKRGAAAWANLAQVAASAEEAGQRMLIHTVSDATALNC